MEDTKIRKELTKIGLENLGEIKHNLSPALLVEEAFQNGEGVLTDTGALPRIALSSDAEALRNKSPGAR